MEQTIGISRAVVVLGMHRSGTSVLMRAVNALGVYIGTNLVPPRGDNPKGFFEDAAILQLNDEMLRAAGNHWCSVLISPPAPDVERQFRGRATALIREHFGDRLLWGFKDPRATRLQAFWHGVMVDAGVHPSYVLASRSPVSVAASLAKRNHMPLSQALVLWAQHQIAGLEAIMRHGGLVVEYQNILRAPEAELRRLAASLSLPYDPANQQVGAFIHKFLEPALGRCQNPENCPDLGDGELGVLCADLYRHLTALSALPPGALHTAEAASQALIERTRTYLMGSRELLVAIDALHSGREEQWIRNRESEEMRELLDKRVNRQERELARIKASKGYRIYRPVADFVKRLLGMRIGSEDDAKG